MCGIVETTRIVAARTTLDMSGSATFCIDTALADRSFNHALCGLYTQWHSPTSHRLQFDVMLINYPVDSKIQTLVTLLIL